MKDKGKQVHNADKKDVEEKDTIDTQEFVGDMTDEDVVELVNTDDIELVDESVTDSVSSENNLVDDIRVKLSTYEVKEAEAKENFNKWQRTLAEFDNFRKRTVKEKSMMYENGAKDVVEKLLPVLDNFERALNHMSEEEKNSAVAQGILMIYKQLLNTFNDLGIVEIDATGKEFDPNLHHAVSHEENDAYGENEVVEVLQKGFIYKERVIRHSMVRVAN